MIFERHEVRRRGKDDADHHGTQQSDERTQKTEGGHEDGHQQRQHDQREPDARRHHLHPHLRGDVGRENLLHPQRQREHGERKLAKGREHHERREDVDGAPPLRPAPVEARERQRHLVLHERPEHEVPAGGDGQAPHEDHGEGPVDHFFEVAGARHGGVDGRDDGVAGEAVGDQAEGERQAGAPVQQAGARVWVRVVQVGGDAGGHVPLGDGGGDDGKDHC
mmetsp:Transcript_42508/g.83573  ORF Transcript_42508/g.83573 Transcript_42508/m.83573 type:complete len:221 (-) Transcript_42508:1482-2144(-)